MGGIMGIGGNGGNGGGLGLNLGAIGTKADY